MAIKLRLPTLKDIKHTIIGILKSTAFLTTNAYLFTAFVCLVRYILGRFYLSTVAFVPTVLASVVALLIERPARRTPLALYVANVGTEALWHMLEARGWVRSLPAGQVAILGCSVTALLYMYRKGVHDGKLKDVSFKALQVLIGKEEQGPLKAPTVETHTADSSQPAINLSSIAGYLQIYDRLRKAKHSSCPHGEACGKYALIGGLKPFVGGIGVQVGLKLLLNISKLIKLKMDLRKQIFNKQSLQLGLALGSFSLLYRVSLSGVMICTGYRINHISSSSMQAISCTLRHSCGHDSEAFAIPAGLLASVGLLQYRSTTISMYVMWKTLHLLYNWGIGEGVLPEVPHFNMLLYASFTGLLFHTGVLEAKTIRGSYYKFLVDISGARYDSPFQRYALSLQLSFVPTESIASMCAPSRDSAWAATSRRRR